MSNVTNAILMHHIDNQAMDEINCALEQVGITSGKFTRVDQYAEGNKYMEAVVHVAGFNHLDERALVAAVRSVPWDSPNSVQLLLKRQDEERFTDVDVFGLHEPNRQRKLAADRGLALLGPSDQQQFHGTVPILLADFQRKTDEIEQNPLRVVPWPRRVAATRTQAPWKFEVLSVKKEFFSREGRYVEDPYKKERTGQMVYTEHRTCQVSLAYRGAAAELECDIVDVGSSIYEQTKNTLATLNGGDIVEFTGSVTVDDDGIWRLVGVETVKKVE